MPVNPELNELQKEVTRQRILETGFRIFAERGIESVTMTDVADAAGIGVATVYRYYGTKPLLALGVLTWSWSQYLGPTLHRAEERDVSAIEEYGYFLDTFLDLYRDHRDLLRFSHYYFSYADRSGVGPDGDRPFNGVVEQVEEQFRVFYRKGKADHTLRCDVPEEEMFHTSLHLMLSAVTRYALGLLFVGGQDPEKELVLLKNMLIREYQTDDHT